MELSQGCKPENVLKSNKEDLPAKTADIKYHMTTCHN